MMVAAIVVPSSEMAGAPAPLSMNFIVERPSDLAPFSFVQRKGASLAFNTPVPALPSAERAVTWHAHIFVTSTDCASAARDALRQAPAARAAANRLNLN